MYADSLAKKNNRSVANNVMSLTDMVSLAGGSVSNIALFLGKKTLESNRIKERLIKRFSKQTKSAIVSPSTESIKKSNIEKKYANPTNIFRSGDVAGGKSMVKPA